MRRRTVLLGAGVACLGSGLAGGVGAFTAAGLSRSATVGVATDDDALVGLVPNEDLASVELVDGELAFAPAVNRDAVYQFGAFVEGGDAPSPAGFSPVTVPAPSDPGGSAGLRSAFAVVNNTGAALRLTCALAFGADGSETALDVAFQFHRDGEQVGDLLGLDGGGGSVTLDLAAGANVGASFLVDTYGVASTDPDDLSVRLTVRGRPTD